MTIAIKMFITVDKLTQREKITIDNRDPPMYPLEDLLDVICHGYLPLKRSYPAPLPCSVAKSDIA